MPDLITREVHVRAHVAADERAVFGTAVPYGETITVWGQRERLAPGAVEGDGAKLFERHQHAVGRIVAAADSPDGWEIKGVFSDTARANDAYALTRDGVYDGLSIGFEVLEHHFERDEDGSDVAVYDRVRVREVSVVPFPAYPSATVSEVREDRTPKENHMTGTATPEVREEDVAEIREGLEDVQRSLTVLLDRDSTAAEPVADERSAGEWLRDIVRGDETTVREYEALVERAYTGGTSADGILTPQYVGDTIRLVESPNVLAAIFATGQLPSKGLQLEYGVLESDTVEVDEQLAEGDDLTKGAIKVDVDHAPIKTYGGHVELTRQQIERTTNVNVLDLHLRALGLRAGRRKATVLRAHYAAVVAANATDADRTIVVADQTDYLDWVGGIVDAAEKFQDLGLPLDALVVDKSVFKTLAGLTATDGRPLMRISGTGVNTVGEIAPKALRGDLASVPVVVNLKQATAGAAFVNGEAIRQYNGSITELADENIVNLSKRFGLYYYASLATEIPDAILPVVAAAPAPAPAPEG